jgi:hypothetical protein
VGLLNELNARSHTNSKLLDYLPEDYNPLNSKVGAYKTISCDKCKHVIHASNNENMWDWIETPKGNYCTPCYLRKYKKRVRTKWVDVITGEEIPGLDEDGYHITRSAALVAKGVCSKCGNERERGHTYCSRCALGIRRERDRLRKRKRRTG